MGNSPKKPTFEEAIGELETIVQQMESGQLTLDECVEKFQRGQKLAQICRSALESAEKKLQSLNLDGSLSEVKSPSTDDDAPF